MSAVMTPTASPATPPPGPLHHRIAWHLRHNPKRELWLAWWTGFKGSTALRTIIYICYLSACFNVFGSFWFHGWLFTPACSMPSDLF